jgi:glycerol-3-phosphate acyltransferase PlsY
VDIREHGSGRTGATNAMRSLGARGFALTFAADAGKAAVAILVARWLAGDAWGTVIPGTLAGIAAIVGHNWSIYIRFKGGRGVACSFGSISMLFWPGAILGLLVFAILLKLTRYVSLGSLGGTLFGLFATLVGVVVGWVSPILAAFAIATAAIVIASHHDNIKRLLAGTERKIGQRAEPA